MRQHLGQPKQIWVAEWSIFWRKLTSTLWFYNQLCKFFEKKEITWYCMHDTASYLEHAQSIWKTTQSVMLYNNQSWVRVNTMQIELYVRLAEVNRLFHIFIVQKYLFLLPLLLKQFTSMFLWNVIFSFLTWWKTIHWLQLSCSSS